MDANGRFLSHKPLESALNELDELPDSQGFVDLAIAQANLLSKEERLLLIFHAFKCGKLDLIKTYRDSGHLNFDSLDEQFLLAHELLQNGEKYKSIEVIQSLAPLCDSSIVQYRALLETLETTPEEAVRIISSKLSKFSGWRQAVLTFNMGVAALNSSRYSTARHMVEQLEKNGGPHHLFFAHWLKGQIAAHKGDNHSALENFAHALEQNKKIPARLTDRGIVLNNAIAECLWLSESRQAQAFLKEINQLHLQGVGTLSTLRFAAARAQTLASSGNFLDAFQMMRSHFDQPEFKRDHLMVAFFYLWLLVFLNKNEELLTVIEKLEIARQKHGQSDVFFDFEAFKTFGTLTASESRQNAENQVLDQFGRMIFRDEKFHGEWIKVFLALLSNDSSVKLQHFRAIKHNVWLKRALITRFSHDESLSHPGFWRILCSENIDPVCHSLAMLKMAMFYKDAERILPLVRHIDDHEIWGWLNDFDDSEGWINSGALREISKSKIIFDRYKGKVLAANGEVLSEGSANSAFLHALAANTGGVSKEEISSLMGNHGYDPQMHDPQIYALVSRTRHWLAKQEAGLDIVNQNGTWQLTGCEYAGYFHKRERKDALAQPAIQAGGPSHLNVRQLWVFNWLKKNNVVTRADLLKNFNIKKSTAVNDFNFLLKENLIERTGQGRAVSYRLKGA
jgi:hypothetical protein